MREYRFETYDVFTSKRFAGNQLAVLFDAEGLSTQEMQTITREFNLSETTFICPPQNSDHTARVRIFTLGYEMPFAGHPTVGTAIAIARERDIRGPMVLELEAGDFPITLKVDGDRYFAAFQNPNLPMESGGAPDSALIEKALGLPAGSVDVDEAKPRLMGAGCDYLYVRAPLAAVQEAKLNTAAFTSMGLENTIGVYLYAHGGETADATWHARMFAPDAGIPEDAATGSAAAGLPGHVIASDGPSDGRHEWLIEQGFEMGRPSFINASVAVENGAVSKVSIGGYAVPVQVGTIKI